jgi:hypothetical protein
LLENELHELMLRVEIAAERGRIEKSKSTARNEAVLTFPLAAFDPNDGAEPLIPE